MFAAYGFLAAVMIFMAFSASLLVLPSFLFIVTRPVNQPSSADEALSPGR
jgi:predicted RND superfamily exporter protein